jgi:ArsR family transcriptional regulator, virulence genes transcriptional regulator
MNCAKWNIPRHIFLLFSTFECSKVSSMENGVPDVTIERLESKAIEVAATLSALANPKRLVVLCNLLAGEKSVGELAEIVQLSQGALSQHLGKMRALRLVATRRDGQTIYYSLASAEVQAVLETLYRVYCAPDC